MRPDASSGSRSGAAPRRPCAARAPARLPGRGAAAGVGERHRAHQDLFAQLFEIEGSGDGQADVVERLELDAARLGFEILSLELAAECELAARARERHQDRRELGRRDRRSVGDRPESQVAALESEHAVAGLGGRRRQLLERTADREGAPVLAIALEIDRSAGAGLALEQLQESFGGAPAVPFEARDVEQLGTQIAPAGGRTRGRCGRARIHDESSVTAVAWSG
ncbi:MAG: hypothetical protein R2862_07615 [Thermoanaerobaculia bacterium]